MQKKILGEKFSSYVSGLNRSQEREKEDRVLVLHRDPDFLNKGTVECLFIHFQFSVWVPDTKSKIKKMT